MKTATTAQTIYDLMTMVIFGLGLTLEPVVFIACLALSLSGAFLGRWYSPVMAGKRAFSLTIVAGMLFALSLLLLDESVGPAFEWWPEIKPQFIAIIGGLFGPLAVPYLLKKFPFLAERLIGRVFPNNHKDGK